MTYKIHKHILFSFFFYHKKEKILFLFLKGFRQRIFTSLKHKLNLNLNRLLLIVLKIMEVVVKVNKKKGDLLAVVKELKNRYIEKRKGTIFNTLSATRLCKYKKFIIYLLDSKI